MAGGDTVALSAGSCDGMGGWPEGVAGSATAANLAATACAAAKACGSTKLSAAMTLRCSTGNVNLPSVQHLSSGLQCHKLPAAAVAPGVEQEAAGDGALPAGGLPRL